MEEYFSVKFEAAVSTETYDTIQFRGKEYRLSRETTVSLCDIDRVAIVHYDEQSIWAVWVWLSEAAIKRVEMRSDQAMAIFLGGELRFAGKTIPRGPNNRIAIGAEDEPEARTVAEYLHSMVSGGEVCPRKEVPPLEVLNKGPSRPRGAKIEPAVLLSSPQQECSEEAIRDKAKGTIWVEVLLRVDGTLDPAHWRLIKGSPEVFEGDVKPHVIQNWRFRPATERGEPKATIQVLEIRYDCKAEG